MAFISHSDKKRGVPGVVAKGKAVAPEVRHAREAIANLIDQNADRLQLWLDEIYQKEGPKAAFGCLAELIEYRIPKLSRVEHKAEVAAVTKIIWGGSDIQ
jgi:hypothetical protein